MITIEERANAYIGHSFEVDEDLSITMARDSYIKGATEQKAIDAHEMDFMSKRIAELAAKENALGEKLVATATKAKLVADDVLGDRNRKNEAKGVLCICWELLDFIDNYGKEE